MLIEAKHMVVPKSIVNVHTPAGSGRIEIREIADSDINDLINLLASGFQNPRRYWELGFARLRTRLVPPDMPRYGYMLEADGKPVGVILLISSLRRIENRQALFSNLSSWYVEPGFRSYAALLFKRALANKQTTYLNVSAATHVQPILDAFGFRRYSEGQVLSPLALARNGRNIRARVVGTNGTDDCGLADDERQMLELQRGYGCLTVCCKLDGRTRPFLFVPRVIKGFIPCVQLAYCREMTDLIEVAGTVGRHLLRLGRPFVLIDADGPIPGIPGRYFPDKMPRYYKGPTTPLRGDLTETEATIFGI